MGRVVLLSVITSTMIMAGGDIKPVEPAAAVETKADWGEVFGQFRTFYIDRTFSGSIYNNRNSLVTGGYIGYKTPDFNGFTAAVAAYGMYGFDIHNEDAKDIGSASYDSSLYGDNFDNYVFIGQAYINYAFANTDVKAGRLELDTPLVGADDARMLPNLFEAVIVSNEDVENTTFIGVHIVRETVGTFGNIYDGGPLGLTSGYGLGMNEALSGDFKNMGTVALGEKSLVTGNLADNKTDGITALAAIYSGIEGLKLQAWDYIAWDILNALYLQADYSYQVNDDLKLNFAAQYINQTDIGDAYIVNILGDGSVDSNYWAVKAGVSFGDLSGYAAYSQTLDSDDATSGNVWTPWGGMPAFTQGMVTRHQFFANTDSWKVAATYNLKEYGVEASVYYAQFDVGLGNIYDPENAWRASELGWDIQYKVAAVEGLSLRARANYPRDFKEGLDWDEYRVIINYNF